MAETLIIRSVDWRPNGSMGVLAKPVKTQRNMSAISLQVRGEQLPADSICPNCAPRSDYGYLQRERPKLDYARGQIAVLTTGPCQRHRHLRSGDAGRPHAADQIGMRASWRCLRANSRAWLRLCIYRAIVCFAKKYDYFLQNPQNPASFSAPTCFITWFDLW